MNKTTLSLDELVKGKNLSAPDFLDSISSDVKEHFNQDPKTIVQEVNRRQLDVLKKKSKAKDYSLYSLFQSVQGLLDQCQPTTNEMFIKQEDGSYILSESANIIASTSAENKVLLLDTLDLFSEVVGEPDDLRKAFIKEKVAQNRYTRRGAEYATLFNNVGDKIFALSTQCLNIQVILNNLIQDQPESEDN